MVWIFEPNESTSLNTFIKMINHGNFLTIMNVDYFQSGRYYCHVLTRAINERYLLKHFSVIVYGMMNKKIILCILYKRGLSICS